MSAPIVQRLHERATAKVQARDATELADIADVSAEATRGSYDLHVGEFAVRLHAASFVETFIAKFDEKRIANTPEGARTEKVPKAKMIAALSDLQDRLDKLPVGLSTLTLEDGSGALGLYNIDSMKPFFSELVSIAANATIAHIDDKAGLDFSKMTLDEIADKALPLLKQRSGNIMSFYANCAAEGLQEVLKSQSKAMCAYTFAPGQAALAFDALHEAADSFVATYGRLDTKMEDDGKHKTIEFVEINPKEILAAAATLPAATLAAQAAAEEEAAKKAAEAAAQAAAPTPEVSPAPSSTASGAQNQEEDADQDEEDAPTHATQGAQTSQGSQSSQSGQGAQAAQSGQSASNASSRAAPQHNYSSLGKVVAAADATALSYYINLYKDEGKWKGDTADMANSLLYLACERGFTECARVLIDEGGAKNGGYLRPDDVTNALHVAAQNNHPETIHLLVDRGADLLSSSGNGQHAVHYAAIGDAVDAIDELSRLNDERLRKRAEVLQSDGEEPDYILADLARRDLFSQVDLLGRTPLHMAADGEKEAAIDALIALKCDPTVESLVGGTLASELVSEENEALFGKLEDYRENYVPRSLEALLTQSGVDIKPKWSARVKL